MLTLQLSINGTSGKLLDPISLDVFICIMGSGWAGGHNDGEMQADRSALVQTEMGSWASFFSSLSLSDLTCQVGNYSALLVTLYKDRMT